jgi:hypothetical protein
MSCTTAVAWSRHVSSSCYTEHGQRSGAVLSDRITTVAMFRSNQLSLRCTVELNCGGLSARLVATSVTCDHALEICELSCVPGVARHLFIPMVHSPLGAVGYMAAPELSSRGGEAGATRQHRSPPQQGDEVRSREHVVAPELSSRGCRARSHGTRCSAGAHLGRKARSRAEEHVTALELNSAIRRGPRPWETWQRQSLPRQEGEVRGCRTCESTGAHPNREERSRATGYVAACGCMRCSLS